MSLTDFLHFYSFASFFVGKKVKCDRKKFPQSTSFPGDLVYFEKISGSEVIREYSSTIWEGVK